MTEPENTDVVTEDVAPPAEETPQAYHEEHQEQAPTPAEMSDKELNFAAMREKTNQLEQKLNEATQTITALHRQMVAPAQPQPAEEVDELDSLAPDEWLTKEQSAKMAQRQAQQAVENSA